ncbi:hypothetical protein CC86DRAFT_368375 [Ophiobolus disseminans]|uniref:Mitochondrial F1F0 ATP synthase-like protein subunit F n=1 Tax=Ophiobolus disseminans TaxID=1469910 RepID=A0A6A7A9Q4_9PLEO|nr:hypothetical protein CC86DRAFT_368375 [Ophiobolus disseminans]
MRNPQSTLNTTCDTTHLDAELGCTWRTGTFTNNTKVIGASPNAVRMQKVVSFYEKLPRGPAPEPQGKGLIGRYQKKYFGKNPSAKPLVHVIGALIAFGYAQNYYFHLRHHKNNTH